MAVFKMYECDFDLTLNGVEYNFKHVDNFQFDIPERVRLTRGANAGNKEGLAYTEGLKDAATVTLTVLDMGKTIFDLLTTAYTNKTRMDVAATSRADGSRKAANQAVLSQRPLQLSMDDSPESLNVALIFESFDIEEVHES